MVEHLRCSPSSPAIYHLPKCRTRLIQATRAPYIVAFWTDCFQIWTDQSLFRIIAHIHPHKHTYTYEECFDIPLGASDTHISISNLHRLKCTSSPHSGGYAVRPYHRTFMPYSDLRIRRRFLRSYSICYNVKLHTSIYICSSHPSDRWSLYFNSDFKVPSGLDAGCLCAKLNFRLNIFYTLARTHKCSAKSCFWGICVCRVSHISSTSFLPLVCRVRARDIFASASRISSGNKM